MSWTAFLAPIIAIGIFVVPILLLRRKAYPRAQDFRKQDFFVTSDRTLPRVIQNSSIAYAIRMATFGPFFAWGAAGDFRPAIVVAVAFALGVLLVYALRRHLLDFLGRALASDGSITVNDFVARLCGNDPRVRRLAACLTVFALAGFILCELIGVANVIKPMLSGDSTATYIWIVGLLVLTAVMTMLSGHSGVMHSAQLQLGILLFGLFTSTVFLIYLQISTLRSMPSRGTFAIAAIVVLCAVLLIYRRNRYIDSTSLRGSDADPNEREPARFRRLRRFQKVLNTTISVVAVLVIVVAGMELYSLGLPVDRERQRRRDADGIAGAGVGICCARALPARLSDRRHRQLAAPCGIREGSRLELFWPRSMAGGAQGVLRDLCGGEPADVALPVHVRRRRDPELGAGWFGCGASLRLANGLRPELRRRVDAVAAARRGAGDRLVDDDRGALRKPRRRSLRPPADARRRLCRGARIAGSGRRSGAS